MIADQKFQSRKGESGQVMVFLALCLVVLMGFAALAIDGGMLFSDRRHAQNAADASSLAGGSGAAYYMRVYNVNYNAFICGTSGTINTQSAAETAAITQAGLNDYVLDNDISDKHGVNVTCAINDLGSYEDKHLDVITKITRDTTTNFAHLVYDGPLRNEVEAIARIYPPAPLAFGKAIVALNKAGCSGNKYGVIFSGSSTTTVTGGGVWSNGCFTGNGTSFTVTVNNGGVGYAGSATGTLTNINPAPQYIPSELPDYSTIIEEPSCTGLPNRTVPKSGDATLEPGIYDEIKWTGGALSFNPGLYCISGSKGMSVTGGSIFGDGVTIYLTSGGVTVNGNVSPIDLRAPEETPDPSPAIPGVLYYLANGNTNTISMTGNSTSFYLGTVYAPDGDLYFSGSSGTNPTFNTQLIGNNVEVSGGATIDINFNDDENFEKPPYLDLLK
ncbi:MAG: Tad domain-containing protein [Anaerolineales bacterium]|nr:Tad domain-containing protein [Anaerolineales bacterium]